MLTKAARIWSKNTIKTVILWIIITTITTIYNNRFLFKYTLNIVMLVSIIISAENM